LKAQKMSKGNFAFWLEVFFRRQATIRQIFLAVVVPAAILLLIWPPVYKSTAKILVQSNQAQAQLLVSPEVQQPGTAPGYINSVPVTEQDLNSESELLTSPYLIEGALAGETHEEKGFINALESGAGRLMDLTQSFYVSMHRLPKLTDSDKLAIKLAKKIDVSVIKRSNVLEVTFKSHDHLWARTFLERLIAQYLALHARISHDPYAEQFFQTQAKLLKDKLHQSEEMLRAAELQTGITSLADQQTALVDEFYELDEEARKARANTAATAQEVASLEAQLKITPKYERKESKIVQNLARGYIKPQLLQMQADRAELLSRYQPTSNRIREIDARIAAAKAIVEHEDQTQVQETTNDLNPTWVDLDSRLAEAHAIAESTSANSRTLDAELKQANQGLGALTNDGLLIQRMQREVDGDKTAYLSYIQKGEEARAAEALNQRHVLNVSVAQPPTLPLRPAFPPLSIGLAAAMLLGFALALCAAYLEEKSDAKIYTARAVVEASGLPIVAVLNERS
jgi:uncharacterized protein involved in exopolysaccharide biosynthesis